MRAREFATKQLNEWNDAMKEKRKRVLLLCMVMCHLIILFDYERNGYFISLEKSKFATPVQDIVGFIHGL